jgi:putative nucleotidyltransferase with HDIG domain
MPSLPTSVIKVLEVCNDPHARAVDLSRIISLDPVLVGRVLKLLNSICYFPGRKVTNLARAIIILGINTVKNLTLSTVVMTNLSNSNDRRGLDMEGFWQHSLCVGVTARFIAKQRGVDPKHLEEYFTAGLLHDIGKIPLNAALPDGYMLTIADADRRRIPLLRAEDDNLGINHCAAGAMIVEAWKLSGPVADTIVYHHNLADYTDEYIDVLYSVAAANRFASAHEIGFSGDRHPEETEQRIWKILGANESILKEIAKNANEEIRKARTFLKIEDILPPAFPTVMRT